MKKATKVKWIKVGDRVRYLGFASFRDAEGRFPIIDKTCTGVVREIMPGTPAHPCPGHDGVDCPCSVDPDLDGIIPESPPVARVEWTLVDGRKEIRLIRESGPSGEGEAWERA